MCIKICVYLCATRIAMIFFFDFASTFLFGQREVEDLRVTVESLSLFLLLAQNLYM